jgi:hypothetical protein
MRFRYIVVSSSDDNTLGAAYTELGRQSVTTVIPRIVRDGAEIYRGKLDSAEARTKDLVKIDPAEVSQIGDMAVQSANPITIKRAMRLQRDLEGLTVPVRPWPWRPSPSGMRIPKTHAARLSPTASPSRCFFPRAGWSFVNNGAPLPRSPRSPRSDSFSRCFAL